METKLFKIEDWYRVLHIRLENGNVIELGNIIVYDEKGIIIDTGYGYFDNDVEISINGNVVRKIKEDFTKKINYIIKIKESYSNESRYTLYIHKNNINLKFLGFKKQIDYVLACYELNGGKSSRVCKSLSENKYELQTEFKEKLESIKYYNLPYEKEELKDIFDKLTEINNNLLSISKKIEDFDIKTMKNEEKEIRDRIEG